MPDPVAEHFDRLALRYSQNFSDAKSGKNYEFRKRAELVGSLVRHSSGVLLDCACGTGEISASALQVGSFSRAVLIDISSAMLDRAAARPYTVSCGAVAFCQCDIFEYRPASSEKFDIILCLGLIAHTGELSRMLTHLKAMLRPNGRILLQISVADHLGVRIVRPLIAGRFARRGGYHLSYFTLADITAECAASGLAVEQISRYCFGLPFGDKIFPLGNYWLERLMEPVSSRLGSEAICVLAHGE